MGDEIKISAIVEPKLKAIPQEDINRYQSQLNEIEKNTPFSELSQDDMWSWVPNAAKSYVNMMRTSILDQYKDIQSVLSKAATGKKFSDEIISGLETGIGFLSASMKTLFSVNGAFGSVISSIPKQLSKEFEHEFTDLSKTASSILNTTQLRTKMGPLADAAYEQMLLKDRRFGAGLSAVAEKYSLPQSTMNQLVRGVVQMVTPSYMRSSYFADAASASFGRIKPTKIMPEYSTYKERLPEVFQNLPDVPVSQPRRNARKDKQYIGYLSNADYQIVKNVAQKNPSWQEALIRAGQATRGVYGGNAGELIMPEKMSKLAYAIAIGSLYRDTLQPALEGAPAYHHSITTSDGHVQKNMGNKTSRVPTESFAAFNAFKNIPIAPFFADLPSNPRYLHKMDKSIGLSSNVSIRPDTYQIMSLTLDDFRNGRVLDPTAGAQSAYEERAKGVSTNRMILQSAYSDMLGMHGHNTFGNGSKTPPDKPTILQLDLSDRIFKKKDDGSGDIEFTKDNQPVANSETMKLVEEIFTKNRTHTTKGGRTFSYPTYNYGKHAYVPTTIHKNGVIDFAEEEAYLRRASGFIDKYGVDVFENLVSPDEEYETVKGLNKPIDARNRFHTPSVPFSKLGGVMPDKRRTAFVDLKSLTGLDGASLFMPGFLPADALTLRSVGFKGSGFTTDFKRMFKDVYGEDITELYAPTWAASDKMKEIFKSQGIDAVRQIYRDPKLVKQYGAHSFNEDFANILNYDALIDASLNKTPFYKGRTHTETQDLFYDILGMVGGMRGVQTDIGYESLSNSISRQISQNLKLTDEEIKENEEAWDKYIHELRTNPKEQLKLFENPNDPISEMVQKDKSLLFSNVDARTRIRDAIERAEQDKRDQKLFGGKDVSNLMALPNPFEIVSILAKANKVNVRNGDLASILSLGYEGGDENTPARVAIAPWEDETEIAGYRYPNNVGEQFELKNVREYISRLNRYHMSRHAAFMNMRTIERMGGGDVDGDTIQASRKKFVEMMRRTYAERGVGVDKNRGFYQQPEDLPLEGGPRTVRPSDFADILYRKAASVFKMSQVSAAGDALAQGDWNDPEWKKFAERAGADIKAMYDIDTTFAKTGVLAGWSNYAQRAKNMGVPFVRAFKGILGAVKEGDYSKIKDFSQVNFPSRYHGITANYLMSLAETPYSDDAVDTIIKRQEALQGISNIDESNPIEVARRAFLRKNNEILAQQSTGRGIIMSTKDEDELASLLGSWGNLVSNRFDLMELSGKDDKALKDYLQDQLRQVSTQRRRLEHNSEFGITQRAIESGEGYASLFKNARLTGEFSQFQNAFDTEQDKISAELIAATGENSALLQAQRNAIERSNLAKIITNAEKHPYNWSENHLIEHNEKGPFEWYQSKILGNKQPKDRDTILGIAADAVFQKWATDRIANDKAGGSNWGDAAELEKKFTDYLLNYEEENQPKMFPELPNRKSGLFSEHDVKRYEATLEFIRNLPNFMRDEIIEGTQVKVHPNMGTNIRTGERVASVGYIDLVSRNRASNLRTAWDLKPIKNYQFRDNGTQRGTRGTDQPILYAEALPEDMRADQVGLIGYTNPLNDNIHREKISADVTQGVLTRMAAITRRIQEFAAIGNNFDALAGGFFDDVILGHQDKIREAALRALPPDMQATVKNMLSGSGSMSPTQPPAPPSQPPIPPSQPPVVSSNGPVPVEEVRKDEMAREFSNREYVDKLKDKYESLRSGLATREYKYSKEDEPFTIWDKYDRATDLLAYERDRMELKQRGVSDEEINNISILRQEARQQYEQTLREAAQKDFVEYNGTLMDSMLRRDTSKGARSIVDEGTRIEEEFDRANAAYKKLFEKQDKTQEDKDALEKAQSAKEAAEKNRNEYFDMLSKEASNMIQENAEQFGLFATGGKGSQQLKDAKQVQSFEKQKLQLLKDLGYLKTNEFISDDLYEKLSKEISSYTKEDFEDLIKNNRQKQEEDQTFQYQQKIDSINFQNDMASRQRQRQRDQYDHQRFGRRSRFDSYYQQERARYYNAEDRALANEYNIAYTRKQIDRWNKELVEEKAKESPDSQRVTDLEGKISTAQASLKRYANAAKEARSEMEQFSAGSSVMAAGLKTIDDAFSRIATRLGRRLFQKALQETIQFVQQFNASMTEIQAITLKTDEEMAKVRTDTIDKAIEMHTSVSNVASTEAALYRQGLSDEEVSTRTEDVIKFASVAGIKVEAATKILTTALQNGLVDTAEDAMDALVALGDNAATTADEIGKAMQKCAAAANVAGVSYGELTAMLATMTSMTQLSGTQVGTAMNTILSRMRQVTMSNYVKDQNGEVTTLSNVETALNLAGIQLRDPNDNSKFRNISDVLLDISKNWGNMSDVTKANITTSVAGTRMGNMFQTLMEGMSEDNGETFEKYLNLATDSTGITDEKYEVKITGLAASLDTLKSSWDQLVAGLESSGVATGFIDGVTGIIQTLGNFVEKAPAFVTSVGVVLTALAAMAAFIAAPGGAIVRTIAAGAAAATMATAFAGISSAIGGGETKQEAEAKQAKEASENYKHYKEESTKKINDYQSRISSTKNILREAKNKAREAGDSIENFDKYLSSTEKSTLADNLQRLSIAFPEITSGADGAVDSLKEWNDVINKAEVSAGNFVNKAKDVASTLAIIDFNLNFGETISSNREKIEKAFPVFDTELLRNTKVGVQVTGLLSADQASQIEQFGYDEFLQEGTEQEFETYERNRNKLSLADSIIDRYENTYGNAPLRTQEENLLSLEDDIANEYAILSNPDYSESSEEYKNAKMKLNEYLATAEMPDIDTYYQELNRAKEHLEEYNKYQGALATRSSASEYLGNYTVTESGGFYHLPKEQQQEYHSLASENPEERRQAVMAVMSAKEGEQLYMDSLWLSDLKAVTGEDLTDEQVDAIKSSMDNFALYLYSNSLMGYIFNKEDTDLLNKGVKNPEEFNLKELSPEAQNVITQVIADTLVGQNEAINAYLSARQDYINEVLSEEVEDASSYGIEIMQVNDEYGHYKVLMQRRMEAYLKEIGAIDENGNYDLDNDIFTEEKMKSLSIKTATKLRAEGESAFSELGAEDYSYQLFGKGYDTLEEAVAAAQEIAYEDAIYERDVTVDDIKKLIKDKNGNVVYGENGLLSISALVEGALALQTDKDEGYVDQYRSLYQLATSSGAFNYKSITGIKDASDYQTLINNNAEFDKVIKDITEHKGTGKYTAEDFQHYIETQLLGDTLDNLTEKLKDQYNVISEIEADIPTEMTEPAVARVSEVTGWDADKIRENWDEAVEEYIETLNQAKDTQRSTLWTIMDALFGGEGKVITDDIIIQMNSLLEGMGYTASLTEEGGFKLSYVGAKAGAGNAWRKNYKDYSTQYTAVESAGLAQKMLSSGKSWNNAIEDFAQEEINTIANYAPELVQYLKLSPEQQKSTEGQNLLRNAQIKFSVAGLSDLEEAGKLTEGLTQKIEQLMKNSKLALQVTLTIETEAYSRTQNAALLQSSDMQEQFTGAKAYIPGLTSTQFYNNPTYWTEQAKQKQAEEDITTARDYDELYRAALISDKEYGTNNAISILKAANAEGFTLVDEGIDNSLPNRIAGTETTEPHFKRTSTPTKIDYENYWNTATQPFTELELANIRQDILNGTVTTQEAVDKKYGKGAWNAAANSGGEAFKAYMYSSQTQNKKDETLRARALSENTVALQSAEEQNRLQELSNVRLESSSNAATYRTEAFNISNKAGLAAQAAFNLGLDEYESAQAYLDAMRQVENWNEFESSEAFNSFANTYLDQNGNVKAGISAKNLRAGLAQYTLYNKTAEDITPAEMVQLAKSAYSGVRSDETFGANYLKSIMGDTWYNQWLNGKQFNEDQQEVFNLRTSNFENGIQGLTTSQVLSGLEKLQEKINIGSLATYIENVGEDYINNVVSGFSGWGEYSALVRKTDRTGEEEKRLQILQAQWEEFKNSAQIKFDVEGIETLEQAGKLLSGTADTIEKLRKGGTIAIEAVFSLRSEAISSGQQTAKLYAGDYLQQDEAAMSILGVNEDVYYSDRAVNLERARAYEEAHREQRELSYLEDYNSAETPEQKQEIEDLAKLAGYEPIYNNDEYKDVIKSYNERGLIVSGEGIVYDRSGKLLEDETNYLKSTNGGILGFKFNKDLLNLMNVNPLAYAKENYNAIDIFTMLSRIMSGEEERTSENYNLYDAAVNNAGSRTQEYLRRIEWNRTHGLEEQVEIDDKLKRDAERETTIAGLQAQETEGEISQGVSSLYEQLSSPVQEAVNEAERSIISDFSSLNEAQRAMNLLQGISSEEWGTQGKQYLNTVGTYLGWTKEEQDYYSSFEKFGEVQEKFGEKTDDFSAKFEDLINSIDDIDDVDISGADSLSDIIEQLGSSSDEAAPALANVLSILEKFFGLKFTNGKFTTSGEGMTIADVFKDSTYSQTISDRQKVIALSKMTTRNSMQDLVGRNKIFSTPEELNSFIERNEGVGQVLDRVWNRSGREFTQEDIDEITMASAISANYGDLNYANQYEKFRGLINESGGIDVPKLEALQAEDLNFGEWISQFQYLQDAMSDVEGTADGTGDAFNNLTDEMLVGLVKALRPWGEMTDEVASEMQNLTGTARTQNNTLKTYRQNLTSISNNQYLRQQFRNGKTSGSDMEAYVTGLGFQKEDIKNADMRDEILEAMRFDELADEETLETELTAGMESVNDKINEIVKANEIKVDGLQVGVGSGSVTMSTDELLANFGSALDSTQQALIDEALAKGVEINWVVDWSGDTTKITPEVALGTGTKGSSGGGGGQSAAQKLINDWKNKLSAYEHEVTLTQKYESHYERVGDWEGYMGSLNVEYEAQIKYAEQIQDAIAGIKEEMDKTAEGTDDWYDLQEALFGYEEKLEDVRDIILDINAKQISGIETRQNNAEIDATHEANMISARESLYSTTEDYDSLYATLDEDITNIQERREKEYADAKVWAEKVEELANDINEGVGSENYITALNNYNTAIENAAQLDADEASKRLEIVNTKINQRSTEYSRATAPLNSQLTLSQDIGATEQDFQNYEGYREQLEAQRSIYQKLGQEAQTSVNYYASLMEQYAEGTPEWEAARTAMIEASDALEGFNKNEFDTNVAIEQSRIDELTKQYNDLSDAVQYYLSITGSKKSIAESINDFASQISLNEENRDTYKQNIEDQLAILSDIDAEMRSDTITIGSTRWDELVKLRRQVIQGIYSDRANEVQSDIAAKQARIDQLDFYAGVQKSANDNVQNVLSSQYNIDVLNKDYAAQQNTLEEQWKSLEAKATTDKNTLDAYKALIESNVITPDDPMYKTLTEKIYAQEQELAKDLENIAKKKQEYQRSLLTEAKELMQDSSGTYSHVTTMLSKSMQMAGFDEDYDTMDALYDQQISEAEGRYAKLADEIKSLDELIHDNTKMTDPTVLKEAQDELRKKLEELSGLSVDYRAAWNAKQLNAAKQALDEYNDKQPYEQTEDQLINDMLARYQSAGDTEAYDALYQERLENLQARRDANYELLGSIKELMATMDEEGEGYKTLETARLNLMKTISDEDKQIDLGKAERENNKINDILSDQQNAETLRQHNMQLVQYAETKYQNAGELTNYGKALEVEKSLHEANAEALQAEIDELTKQRDEETSNAENKNKLTKEIMRKEEALKSETNAIEENTKQIRENNKAILQTRKDLEDAVKDQLKTNQDYEDQLLDDTVSAQQAIMESIRQRYEDEWELIQKDLDKKKDALNEEKNMLNERVQARKNARSAEDKEEELAELNRQMALIASDPTRSKEYKELEKKRSDLNKELADIRFENMQKAREEEIDDEIKAYDKLSEYEKERRDEYVKNENNFADEISEAMKSPETFANYLAQFSETYKNSLSEGQLNMFNEWIDMLMAAQGNDYELRNGTNINEETARLLENRDSFLEFMQNSVGNREYQTGTEAAQGIMNIDLEDLYDNWVNAMKDDAVIELHDHEWAEGVLETANGWTWKVEPIEGTDLSYVLEAFKKYGYNFDTFMDMLPDALREYLESSEKYKGIGGASDYSGSVKEGNSSSYYDGLPDAKEDWEDEDWYKSGKTPAQISAEKLRQNTTNFQTNLTKSLQVTNNTLEEIKEAVQDNDEPTKKNGWEQEGEDWYYYRDDVASSGWDKIDGTWYMFDPDTKKMKTGWYQDENGTWYYLDASGAMKTGWNQVGDDWYYHTDSGAMVTGEYDIDGVTNRFEDTGRWVGVKETDSGAGKKLYDVMYDEANEEYKVVGKSTGGKYSYAEAVAQANKLNANITKTGGNSDGNGLLSKDWGSLLAGMTDMEAWAQYIMSQLEDVPKNAEGGLVDYTGLAWVDGTKARPESFLDATDTALLRNMLDAFNYVSVNPGIMPSDDYFNGNTTNVGDIVITINQAELNNDQDIEKLAQKVGKAFTKELSKDGLNLAAYAF